jgi:hypothetical protein
MSSDSEPAAASFERLALYLRVAAPGRISSHRGGAKNDSLLILRHGVGVAPVLTARLAHASSLCS